MLVFCPGYRFAGFGFRYVVVCVSHVERFVRTRRRIVLVVPAAVLTSSLLGCNFAIRGAVRSSRFVNHRVRAY